MSNWIEWKGGECPVTRDSVIDVRYRSGAEVIGSFANSVQTKSSVWGHHGDDLDITAYRIRQEAPAPTIEQLLAKANRHAAKAEKHERKRAELVERANKLKDDEMKAELEEMHRVYISGAKSHCGGIKALYDAGYRLAAAEDSEPAEDMTDPVNWKAGDVVEYQKDFAGGYKSSKKGALGQIACIDAKGIKVHPGGQSEWLKGGLLFESGEIDQLKWISRPQGESA